MNAESQPSWLGFVPVIFRLASTSSEDSSHALESSCNRMKRSWNT